jgi:hypothetical protein
MISIARLSRAMAIFPDRRARAAKKRLVLRRVPGGGLAFDAVELARLLSAPLRLRLAESRASTVPRRNSDAPCQIAEPDQREASG